MHGVNGVGANVMTCNLMLVAQNLRRVGYGRGGEAYVVMSADDWEREQETLYVLQNIHVMQQMADSLKTHNRGRHQLRERLLASSLS